MRIGAEIAGTHSARNQSASRRLGSRFMEKGYSEAVSFGNTAWAFSGGHLPLPEDREEESSGAAAPEAGAEAAKESNARSEAEKIYQAAVAGKPNPLAEMREIAKVPYGHLAKDGVIEYNGVVFVCDEKTNSICLGDMTDEKNVLNIPLSGGGHLKVNRNSIGLLSKAAGMFSSEDLNLIMRAIAQDTKIQSVKKEIEDEEASVGSQLHEESEGASAGDQLRGEESEEAGAGNQFCGSAGKADKED